jgi:hypothetical protein
LLSIWLLLAVVVVVRLVVAVARVVIVNLRPSHLR